MSKYYHVHKILLPIILLFSSCITIDQKFGDDLIPNEQNLTVSRKILSLADFGSLISASSDSFPTSGVSVGFIGQMTTPEFGFSKVSLMTQLSLISPGYTLPVAAEIDSVVMYVAFTTDKFGNPDDMTLKVYEVTKDLTDSVYYGGNKKGFEVPSFSTTPLCSGTFNKYTKTMQMKVPHTEELLNKLKTFDSDTSFRKGFNGIYMTVEGSRSGAIKGIDLLTYRTTDGIYYASTYLRMHFKYFHPTAQRDTVGAYTYICQSIDKNNDQRFLITQHDEDGEIAQTRDPKISYTQGLYGVIGNLKLNRETIERTMGKDLQSIAINRAELRLKLERPLDVTRLDSFYTPLIGTYNKKYSATNQPYYGYTLDFNKYISSTSQGVASTYDGTLNRTSGSYNIEITHALNNMIRTGVWDPLLLLPQSYGQSCKSAAFITDSTQLVITYVHKK